MAVKETMKIRVPSIPEEGLFLDFDQKTPWFAALLKAGFIGIHRPDTLASGHVALQKTLQNVSLSGELSLALQLHCASCGVDFETSLEVPLVRNLAPFFTRARDEMLTQEEEIELSADDLEFSFYHKEEINLGEILSEEINLALPIRFVCQESCRGLCPRCGINLNQGRCACPQASEASPFAVLKGIKLKS